MCAFKNGKSEMLNKNGKYHLLSRLDYTAILTKALKHLELALNREGQQVENICFKLHQILTKFSFNATLQSKEAIRNVTGTLQ